jgi:hypothetical protein
MFTQLLARLLLLCSRCGYHRTQFNRGQVVFQRAVDQRLPQVRRSTANLVGLCKAETSCFKRRK